MKRPMKNIGLISIILFLTASIVSGQSKQNNTPNSTIKLTSEKYGSDAEKLKAENILIYQKEIGGWDKSKKYNQTLSETEKESIIQNKDKLGGTFDNGATISELRFLAKIYAQTKDERFKKAFDNGLNFIFNAQYENGGWPQYYPALGAEVQFNRDKTAPYSGHITYNDNAMVNIMNFLKEIFSDNKEYISLEISNETKIKAQKAFNKGVECILKTQIFIDGKPTVWCAQHDEITLAPANARAYELASFSGSESVKIVSLLMSIDNPSNEIIAAVNGAVLWFENHKIEGIKIVRIVNEEGKRDRIVVEDKDAPAVWGRFHDLETGKPIFCDRDGIKKNSLAEIGYERRNGYGWYTRSPKELLEKYPEWKNSKIKN
ncbi:MAG: pectate lyase [Bacteroidales bacterium]